MSETVDRLRDALATESSVDGALDHADAAIERETAAGNAAALGEIAVTLEAAASARDETWTGLTIAAARARAAATRLGGPGSPSFIPQAAPEPAAAVAPAPVVAPPTADVMAKPVYAGWWRRLGALSLDLFGLGTALTFLDIVAGSAGDGTWLLYLGLSAAYFAGFYAFHGGSTLGMEIVGIAVRRKDGQPISLGAAIVRTVALFVLVVSGIGALIDAIAAAAARGRSVHDAIAGTVVVRRR